MRSKTISLRLALVKQTFIFFLSFFFFLSALPSSVVALATPEIATSKAKKVVMMLDILAKEYDLGIENGNVVNVIDFTEFLESGDRSNFISIQPNDTFIIKQTPWSYMLQKIGTVNTLMNFLNLYLNISNLISK